MMSPQRSGFTLFEVAISLGILAVGVVGILLLFPVGLKTQQMARFRLYACAKAEEMIEAFNAAHTCNTAMDAEAPNPWDVPIGYRNMAPDLECRLANPQFGIMPVPIDIARRLDSEGDEIAHLLSEGGYLYYSQPMSTTGVIEMALDNVVATESQKLVIGVTGYAQDNAVTMFPWKAWPYYYPYPSPPAHGIHDSEEYLASTASTYVWPPTSNGPRPYQQYGWEYTSDPDAAVVFWDVEPNAAPDGSAEYGFQPYAYGAQCSAVGAMHYLQAALWYCARKGLPLAFIDPPAPASAITDFTRGGAVPPWQQVAAMRYLAHAAITMTRWYDLAALGGQPSSGAGVIVPPVMLKSQPSAGADLVLTHDKIAYYHESALNLIMRFAACYPYDWGVPRPLQRGTMMDFPLLEYDLHSPGLTGTITGSAEPAVHWRPIASQPISNLGRSFQYPESVIAPYAPTSATTVPNALWGEPDHFTLTQSFAATERCRQLVFWAVDWMAYEDFETAPSAPVDAAKYVFAAPMTSKPTFVDRMNYLIWSDPSLFVFRNPEKNLMFTDDVSGRATGDGVWDLMMKNKFDANPNELDNGYDPRSRKCFSGLFGADRNFNKVLDRGPVPKSVRMRAQLVARFNFYDPRVSLTVR